MRQTLGMPVGLDGNPDPIVTPARSAVMAEVAARIARFDHPRVAVGVDGRSGVGKSTFADELATLLRSEGSVVVRSTTDLFHRPLIERMRRGVTSPEGYYRDSHQVGVIVDELLEPFGQRAPAVLTSAFDEPSDQPRRVTEAVPERAVLVFDGLFVCRPELRTYWDLSIMLEADRRCDAAWLGYLESGLPNEETDRAAELDRRLERARWPRYRQGWRHYLEVVGPTPADVVVDNDDLSKPVFIEPT